MRSTVHYKNIYIVWTFPSSLATTKGISSIYFPLVTEMFHFTRFSSYTYEFSVRFPDLIRKGFPIRTSPDQSLLGSSPRLIAPCNVLLRLLVPRHPPCALVEIAHNENTHLCFHCNFVCFPKLKFFYFKFRALHTLFYC